MYDPTPPPTPPPYGDVTRRWTLLDRDTRHRQAVRLLGSDCGAGATAHVDRPGLDAGACYHRLVPAAASGDPVALGWVAATHRPLLVTRGRVLFEHDPGEWGSVCLEALHRTFASADLSETTWLRRRVARALATRLSLIVGQHLDRRRRECPVANAGVHARHAADPSWEWDPHPDLSLDLDRVLAALDEPTRDSLLALANREPLAEVAERHGLSYNAVRQRVSRARKRLRPELAGYVRTAPAA